MIYIFLAPGFEQIEALTPLDILRRANLEVTTVGIGGELIKSSHGVTITADMADYMYTDQKPDMIILPGGMPGTNNLDASPVVDVALKAAVRNQAYLAAICAAPLILGKRGYLEGKKAVCYPGFEDQMLGYVPCKKGRSVIADGKIITARAMGVSVDFGLKLVEVLKGKDEADRIKASIFSK